jgi:hypothetical protein
MARPNVEEYDADELYEDTEPDTIKEWLEACEGASTVTKSNGGPGYSKWEQDFLESIREQFDEKRNDRKHPLSGKQLVKLHQLYDRT